MGGMDYSRQFLVFLSQPILIGDFEFINQTNSVIFPLIFYLFQNLYLYWETDIWMSKVQIECLNNRFKDISSRMQRRRYIVSRPGKRSVTLYLFARVNFAFAFFMVIHQ